MLTKIGKRQATNVVSNESDETNEGCECTLCNVNFKKKSDKVLECAYCAQHFCTQCLDMPAKLYDFLTSRIDVKWFCPNCNEKVERNLKADRDIEDDADNFCKHLNID